MDRCGLQDVTLVGFSMGGGEVARCVARHGESRLHSVVFAAAVTPCLMKSADNPDGPLTSEKAQHKKAALEQDRNAYFDEFTKNFFSADGVLQVTELRRAEAYSQMVTVNGAPHGLNVSHAQAFNETLLSFLRV